MYKWRIYIQVALHLLVLVSKAYAASGAINQLMESGRLPAKKRDIVYPTIAIPSMLSKPLKCLNLSIFSMDLNRGDDIKKQGVTFINRVVLKNQQARYFLVNRRARFCLLAYSIDYD